MNARLAKIKRGPLSDAERAEIERLAATLKNPTPGAIARRLNRHNCTVNWYLITHGLITRPLHYGLPISYQRGDGIVVNRYTREQDAHLIELRRGDATLAEIAARMTARFGIPRNAHSVKVRLIMLGAYSDGPESEVA